MHIIYKSSFQTVFQYGLLVITVVEEFTQTSKTFTKELLGSERVM